jgi:hypothetical protein
MPAQKESNRQRLEMSETLARGLNYSLPAQDQQQRLRSIRLPIHEVV